MKDLLGLYRNGDYRVIILSDGTKIRFNDLDSFHPDFPESIDMKISDRCDRGCPMCHERSTKNGALADLEHPLLASIPPYTELALGGGNIFEHPGIVPFLERMKEQKVICNATVHEAHFLERYNEIRRFVDEGLLHGVGVSVDRAVDSVLLGRLASIPSLVVHVIAGIVDEKTIRSLAGHGLKLLILGYKNYGRGADYLEDDANECRVRCGIEYLSGVFDSLKRDFSIVSFDNLALEQLRVRDKVEPEVWEHSYMGDDGSFTMYVDLVKNQYAVSSVSPRHDIDSDDIRALFGSVRRGRRNDRV